LPQWRTHGYLKERSNYFKLACTVLYKLADKNAVNPI
jgi:hypothetical protein